MLKMKGKLTLFSLGVFLLLFLIMQTVNAFSGNSTNYNIPIANINYAAYNGSSSNYKIEFSLIGQAVANATNNYILYLGYFSPTALLEDGSSCTRNEECSSGYCVHSICRSTAIYCGDGYCDSGEDCSSCPSDCGVCPSGGGYPTFKPTQEQLKEGYERSLRKNWKIHFEFNNETHTIKLNDIVNKTSVITISTEPITFNLTINETKKLNLDDDNYYDLQVFLKDISDYEADLVVKIIHEEIPKEEEVVEEEKEKEPEKEEVEKLKLWLIPALVIIIAIVVIIKHIRYKSKRK